jgi:hypothetical protein
MANSVVQAIVNVAGGDPHLEAAMLMGSSLESGWNVSSVGDQGTSFGPFQIHLPAHPGVTASQASDPTFAAQFMKPAYQAGVAKVNPGLWQSDPAQAAATAAYYAERPAKMYSGYESKWSQVQAAMGGTVVGPVTGSPDIGGAGGGATDPVTAAADDIASQFKHGVMTLANMALYFSAIAFGGTMLLVGLILIFRETGSNGVVGNVGTAVNMVNPVRVVRIGVHVTKKRLSNG